MNILAGYLSELIRAQFDGRKPQPIPKQLTVEELYNISQKGHMDYLFLGALIKLDELSEEWKDVFRKRVLYSIAKTLAQVTEIRELRDQFEEHKVSNQPMKGAWMKFIYPSPEMREMSDVDILIRQDCAASAANVFDQRGYKLVKSIKHHEIYRKSTFVTVEAHKSLYDKTVDVNQFNYFSNFSRAKIVEGSNYTYNFDVNDFYIYMIAHMAKHFYTMGCGIRNLLDIYVYLEKKGKEMDRQYIELELKKLGLLTFTEQMEELAYVWMENRESTELQQNIFDYMVEGGIYGKDENGIWNKYADVKKKGKNVSRLRLKIWYYFPPHSYMCEYYPYLEEYSFLYPWAWCVRACRGLFCKKGVHKRELLREIDEEKIDICQRIYQAMELHF